MPTYVLTYSHPSRSSRLKLAKVREKDISWTVLEHRFNAHDEMRAEEHAKMFLLVDSVVTLEGEDKFKTYKAKRISLIRVDPETS